jgi:hypothetical protein
MSWKDHFQCKVSFQSNGSQHTWSSKLPLPQQIPLKELLLNQSSLKSQSKKLKQSLSLEHRKALWVYQNIDQKVWKKLTREFTSWINSIDQGGVIELEVYEAATPVILHFLSQTKMKNKIKVRVHKAPLAWLEKEFARTKKKNVSLSLVPNDLCPWSDTPLLTGKLAA